MSVLNDRIVSFISDGFYKFYGVSFTILVIVRDSEEVERKLLYIIGGTFV